MGLESVTIHVYDAYKCDPKLVGRKGALILQLETINDRQPQQPEADWGPTDRPSSTNKCPAYVKVVGEKHPIQLS
jgi:hypothetical protein